MAISCKSGKSGKTVCVLIAALATGVACHTRPPAAAPARTNAVAPAVPERPPSPPPPREAARPASAPLTDAEIFERKSLDQLNNERPLSDVFFDYDQNVLRDEGRHALEQDAKWLAKWPSTVVRIDGHCDERGTGEYNLALGDRRAETVRDYLVNLGVSPTRLEVRSLGKEAPFCHEDGEACWSQNRRDHFVITKK
jgi:peptidoglycan-associated lipoprotein